MFSKFFMPARLLLLGGLAVTLAACSGAGNVDWQLTNVTGHLPDLQFQLTGDNGQPRTAEALRGKIVLVYFGYTHCPDVCPLSMTHLHMVMRKLGKQADQARIVFVSVDPKRDTPEVLHRYVTAFDKHAIGLTGSIARIRKFTKAYRVAFDVETPDNQGHYEVSHSSAVFIFDRKGHARLVTTDTENVAAITHDVRELIEGV